MESLSVYNDLHFVHSGRVPGNVTTERSQHLSTTLKIDEETGTSEYPEMTFIIDLVDNVCAVYFAMEYFMRLTCSPKKIKFFFRIAIN